MARQKVKVEQIQPVSYPTFISRLHAFYAMNMGAYVSDEDTPLHSNILNPEQAYERKESFEYAYAKMSTEAQTIMTILLNAPTEVLELICGPHRTAPTITRLKKFVRESCGWNYRKTGRAVKELKAYANSI